jgi:ribonuclease-3
VTVVAELGYDFGSEELVTLALTHRSYAAEHGLDCSYERLEFLGDAVLQLIVTRYLYDRYDQLAEGEMAKVRAAVVNQKALATIARKLHVGDSILLGQGEETSGGRNKDSILADVVESLLGAIYLDGGYSPVEELVLRHWIPVIEERATAPGRRDYKTRLQELLAQRGHMPRYELTESGPDHAKVFEAELWVGDRLVGRGRGSSKKRAEQAAAADATGLFQ